MRRGTWFGLIGGEFFPLFFSRRWMNVEESEAPTESPLCPCRSVFLTLRSVFLAIRSVFLAHRSVFLALCQNVNNSWLMVEPLALLADDITYVSVSCVRRSRHQRTGCWSRQACVKRTKILIDFLPSSSCLSPTSATIGSVCVFMSWPPGEPAWLFLFLIPVGSASSLVAVSVGRLFRANAGIETTQ